MGIFPNVFSAVTVSPSLAEIFGALPVILSLIIIEGLLSVDNALALAAMARHLPEDQQRLALRLGIFGAYLFRGLCMVFAAWIIENPWLKICGAAYLLYLTCKHFAETSAASESARSAQRVSRGFLSTIIAIEIMDLSLSVDNVVAAVAMSPKLWVVCTGVFIGILVLRFVAGACIKLIERYPILEAAAFLMVGYVGLVLVIELFSDPQSGFQVLPGPIHINAVQKFAGIVLILGASLLYSRIHRVQRVLSPVLKLARLPMDAFAFFVGALIKAALMPFVLLYRLGRKRS